MITAYEIKDRCEQLALYVIDCKCTVRAAATHFGISKSTVHKDLTVVLPGVNKGLYLLVKDVLEYNKAERHYRGGEATRLKYLGMQAAEQKETRIKQKQQQHT